MFFKICHYLYNCTYLFLYLGTKAKNLIERAYLILNAAFEQQPRDAPEIVDRRLCIVAAEHAIRVILMIFILKFVMFTHFAQFNIARFARCCNRVGIIVSSRNTAK